MVRNIARFRQCAGVARSPQLTNLFVHYSSACAPSGEIKPIFLAKTDNYRYITGINIYLYLSIMYFCWRYFRAVSGCSRAVWSVSLSATLLAPLGNDECSRFFQHISTEMNWLLYNYLMDHTFNLFKYL